MNFISDTASTNRILSQSEKNIHVQPSACLNSLPQRNKNATSYFMGVTYSQIPMCHTKLFCCIACFLFENKKHEDTISQQFSCELQSNTCFYYEN